MLSLYSGLRFGIVLVLGIGIAQQFLSSIVLGIVLVCKPWYSPSLIQGVSKKWWVVCTACLVFYRLKSYIFTCLFDTHTNYDTIHYHSGIYSFLTDEKWAYGENFEITYHKDHYVMFLNCPAVHQIILFCTIWTILHISQGVE